MGVDLLGFVLVEADETVQDVVASSGVIWAAFVVREVILHRADGELLLESVDLVEEKDNAGLDKPSRVADTVEEGQSLLHTVDRLILEEQLVVFGNSNKEEDRSDVLEAVDPLLALRSLSTNIEHSVSEIANDERGLGDTGCLDS